MADLASQPTSVQTIYSWYRDGKLLVNRRYQRKLVWTLEEKQKLIESLLKKYPVPAILLAERDGGPATYEIIDGLQRLHSIVSFIENAFPSIFAVLLIAFHELIVGDVKKVADYDGLQGALENISSRIEAGRKATAPEERRKNINAVKGIIGSNFVATTKLAEEIYSNHTTVDIESVIRRSEIELANYELKQGLLVLEVKGAEDPQMIAKVVKTICAIANIGPNSAGKILIGVTDKKADADRIKKIDAIDAKKVGKRFVVGVNREAKRLGISVEKYFAKWKDGIKNLAFPLIFEMKSFQGWISIHSTDWD